MTERITGNTFYYLAPNTQRACPVRECPLKIFSHFIREKQTELTFDDAQEEAIQLGFQIENLDPVWDPTTDYMERRSKAFCRWKSRGNAACGVIFLSERSI